MNTAQFDLDNHNAYAAWREQKLADYPTKLEQLMVEIKDLTRITDIEKQALLTRCHKTNMALFKTNIHWQKNELVFINMLKQLGVFESDKNLGANRQGVSSLSVGGAAYKPFADYTPYQNTALGWHTDGYYNASDKQVLCVTLLCYQPADEGGENGLLDHEIAYILLRDKNPEYIRALMAKDVMTIPARLENGKIARPDRVGAVFSVINGYLHMRYTARTKSIFWKQDDATQQAIMALQQILNTPSEYKFQAKLRSGWGLVSNNVLHTRTAYQDQDKKRALERVRFTDRLK